MKKNGFPKASFGGDWSETPAKNAIQEYLTDGLAKNVIHKQVVNGLYIFGGVGTGKTTLMAMIARTITKFYAVTQQYLPVVDLFTSLYTNDQTAIKNAAQTAVLYLDDLGQEYQTEYLTKKFNSFINRRYEERLPTFFTSNFTLLDLSQIPGYEQVADRINDSEWCNQLEITGVSKRKAIKGSSLQTNAVTKQEKTIY